MNREKLGLTLEPWSHARLAPHAHGRMTSLLTRSRSTSDIHVWRHRRTIFQEPSALFFIRRIRSHIRLIAALFFATVRCAS